MLSAAQIESCGVFQTKAVERLVHKARTGRAIGAKDNMALVGILSTQILVDRMIRSFRPESENSARLDGVKLGSGEPSYGGPLSPIPGTTTN
jgi:asparagine synthase (glutamine-hydrolysing)